ncbi:MAG: FG-GAP-like repeat-containing protein [Bacteroidales bacterium]|nr:FG-GAP-like repeat-containing protein [Bacteroidales bacterium]
MRKILLILAGLLMLSFYADTRSEYSIAIKAKSVCLNDIDSDGGNEIIVGHGSGSSDNTAITIMDNLNNSGIFEIENTYDYIGRGINVFAIRVNDDEHSDLINIYENDDTKNIRVHYNDGNGNFSEYSDYSLNTSSTIFNIDHGDINGDGHEDIVYFSHVDFFWAICYNDGNGGFESPIVYSDLYPAFDITCGDMDGNGRDDIIIGGAAVAIYYSYDTGFVKHQYEHTEHSLEIIDFDLDGDNDLVSATWLGGFEMEIAENINNEPGNFNIHYYQPSGLYTNTFITSDFNNDSLPDLLFTPSKGPLKLIYNKDSFNITEAQTVNIPTYWEDARKSASADMDGNGYNDIVTVRYFHTFLPSNLNIKFNDGEGSFVNDPITSTNQTLSQYKNEFKCYPNPFKDDLTIEFKLKHHADVEISVYSIQGKLIKTIIRSKKKGGKHTLKWRGLDKAAKPCKPGAYIVYLKVNGIIHQSVKLIKY